MRKLILLAAAAVMTGLTTIPASADNLVWRIRKSFNSTVYVEFYSSNSRRAWPGNGRAYILRNRRFYRFSLRCRYGEKICYGAWTRNERRYWGVGRYGERGCRNCCYRCGYGTTRRITLTR